jgi:WD40 repeat protein
MAVRQLSFAPDGTRLASVGAEPGLAIWTVGERVELERRFDEDDELCCVAWGPRWIVSAGYDEAVTVRDAKTLERKARFRGHRSVIFAVAASPDGRLVASGSQDDSVRVWDVEKRVALATLYGHRNAVGALAWSPDGKILASGSADATVRLWSGESFEDVGVLPAADGIDSIEWSSDGRMLAVASSGGSIKFWPLDSILTGASSSELLKAIRLGTRLEISPGRVEPSSIDREVR